MDTPISDVAVTKNLRLSIKELVEVLNKSSRKSRSRALSIQRLEEASMWLGKDLQEMNEPTPYPRSTDPTDPVIDKTAPEACALAPSPARETLTTDPSHPGVNKPGPSGQNETYLVLPEAERAKGFVRPVRRKYIHQKCGTVTSMGPELAETYARNPKFYGATFCCSCAKHFPVGEFVWDGTAEVVGS